MEKFEDIASEYRKATKENRIEDIILLNEKLRSFEREIERKSSPYGNYHIKETRSEGLARFIGVYKHRIEELESLKQKLSYKNDILTCIVIILSGIFLVTAFFIF